MLIGSRYVGQLLMIRFLFQEAAGKGLIAGSFRLIRDSQVVLDARSTFEVSRILASVNGNMLTILGHLGSQDTR